MMERIQTLSIRIIVSLTLILSSPCINILLAIFTFLVSPNLSAQDYQWAIAPSKDTSNVGNSSGEAYDITVDGNGNVISTGYFNGKLDFDPSADSAYLIDNNDFYDIFIAKYDSNGNYVWAHSFGDVSSDRGRAVSIDATENVYVSGNYGGKVDFDPSPDTAFLNDGNGFMVKYTPNGDFVWANATGGVSVDIIYSNGAIVSTGGFSGKTDFDPTQDTSYVTGVGGFISKYDPDGTFLWVKAIQGTVDSKGIANDKMGNLYITGTFSGTVDFDPSTSIANLTSPGNNIVFIAKYDIDGNYLWALSIGGNGLVSATALAIDDNNNIYITGGFRDSIDFDPSLSNAHLEGGLWGDIFFAKFDADGKYVWAKSIGGLSWDSGNDITVDATGYIYLTGYFKDSADFDPSNNIAQFVSAGEEDIFIAKYDSNGKYQWCINMGGPSYKDVANTIALTASGEAYIAGEFLGLADFDPSADSVILDGTLYFAKYSANSVGLDEINREENLAIYPNPVSNKLNIENKKHLPFTYHILDYLGRQIFFGKETSDLIILDFSTLANGIYFIKIELEDKNTFYTETIIKANQ